jgi:Spy/CpxP family protein refolding chaperone
MTQDGSDQQVNESQKEGRRVSAWVAGLGAVVFLLAVGGFIYWFMGGAFAGTSGLIPDPARADREASRGRNWRQQANADGVHPLPGATGYFVRVGQAYMDIITPTDKKQETSYRFRYDSQGLLPADQWHLVSGVRRVATDAKMAETLNVTKDQLDRLRKYGQVSMELSKRDRETLVSDWEAYSKATAKAEPEKKLVAALKDVSGRALAVTKSRASDRVAEISKVFTPEQARELMKLGAGQNVTAIVPAGKKPTTQRAATRAA